MNAGAFTFSKFWLKVVNKSYEKTREPFHVHRHENINDHIKTETKSKQNQRKREFQASTVNQYSLNFAFIFTVIIQKQI